MPQRPSQSSLRRSRFWFRVIAVSSPVILLLALEGALRLAGYGYPTSFFLRTHQAGKAVLIDNPKFGWRFFPREVARTSQPLSITAEKSPNTIRVFVFGESAAMGDPEPSYGFARQLERILQAKHPGQNVEVVNVAMTAINSHVIREIAKDCAPLHADYWLIFAGNNEVVGPFGAGTVFGGQAPPLALVRLNLALKKLRVGQLVARLARSSSEPKSWEGMELFLAKQVSRTDPRLSRVYRSFQSNLNDIGQIGRRSGAQVLLATIPVNLAGSPPFASVHRSGLTPADLQSSERSVAAVRQAYAEQRLKDALIACARAAQIDPDYAQTVFLQAQTEFALGQIPAAESNFSRARDLDALRFRADSRINQIIRETAGHFDGRLLEAEKEIAQAPQTPGSIGDELFYDHVHLNFAGNFRVASLFAAAMEKSWPNTTVSPGEPVRISQDEAAKQLAFTDFDQRRVGEEMRARLQQPPFSSQSNYHQRDEYWRGLLAAIHPDTNTMVSVYRYAVALATNDWVLHDNFARVLESMGDRPAASAAWTTVTQLLPHYTHAWFNLARLADEMGDRSKAWTLLERAFQRDRESVEIITEMGVLLAQQGATNQARERYRAALHLEPGFSPARVNLGILLAQSGDPTAAKAEYHRVLKSDPENVDARVNLANLLTREGGQAAVAAGPLYEEALKLQPDNPIVHYHFGRWLMANDRPGNAIPHFRTTLEQRPDNAEAHYELGHALAKTGNNAAALDEFAATVRLNPRHVEAHLNYGVALAKAQHFSEAAAQFRETLRLRPDHPLAGRMLDNAVRAMQQDQGR